MSSSNATPDRRPAAVNSKKAWGARAVHDNVTLPSGAIVSIKLPNLGQLIKAGTIPNALLESALELDKAKEITPELVVKNFEYAAKIVPLTVVKPEITEADVLSGLLPSEDLELILSFAGRQTDMDATHQHLGGLDTVKSFRDARGIFRLEPDGDDS